MAVRHFVLICNRSSSRYCCCYMCMRLQYVWVPIYAVFYISIGGLYNRFEKYTLLWLNNFIKLRAIKMILYFISCDSTCLYTSSRRLHTYTSPFPVSSRPSVFSSQLTFMHACSSKIDNKKAPTLVTVNIEHPLLRDDLLRPESHENIAHSITMCNRMHN